MQKEKIMEFISSRSWRMTKWFRRLEDVSRRLSFSLGSEIKVSKPLDNYDKFIEAERERDISVLVPVYKDKDLTKACIESAMSSILDFPDGRLLVVNDASPDPDMASMLEKVASRWPKHVEILTNRENQGFVLSVNRGMKHRKRDDIVLLNSDVILPPGWLKRLALEAYSRPQVATVTPLSNNTTICTFPEFLQENTLFPSSNVEEIDAAFRLSSLPNVEAPTGIGFCMYIRRDCLDIVGYFDSKKFGRGYGEENDFCRRAIKHGWCNLITPNIYVFHKGGVSFGLEKKSRVEKASRLIEKLYPEYHGEVQNFIRQDPLKEARILRLIAFLANLSIPKVLFVAHGLGGGANQYLEELAEYFHDQSRAFPLFLMPEGGDHYRLRFGFRKTADEIGIRLPVDYEFIVKILTNICISLVHFNHAMNVDPILYQLPGNLGIPYYLSIHDYFLINGNPTLADKSGVFSNKILQSSDVLPNGMTPEEWRKRYRSFVESARIIIFPSSAVKRFFSDYFCIGRGLVAQHIEKKRNVLRKPKGFFSKKSYTIAALGALNREKGADYLEEIALHAEQRGLPLSFILIGYGYRPLEKVTATGPYHADETLELITKKGCDILFFPVRIPETYSYTLSYALASGLPIIAPNLGAFPERLAKRDNVFLFSHKADSQQIVEQLMNFVSSLEKGEEVVAPNYSGEKIETDFYSKSYFQEIAVRLSNVHTFINQGNIDLLKSYRIVRQIRKTFREKLLSFLWSLYSIPFINRACFLFPYRFRRFVKQALSRRPIHDLIAK